jgi:hypothetical protein
MTLIIWTFMDDGSLLGYKNSKEDPHFMNHTLVPITYTLTLLQIIPNISNIDSLLH